MRAYQITLAIILLIGFLSNIHCDINGQEKKEPHGFSGVVITMLMTSLVVWIFYKAGAFSTLIEAN